MVYPGLHWFILVYNGLSWFIMVYPGLSWFILVYHGLSWFILVYRGLLWFIVVYCGLLWFIVVYQYKIDRFIFPSFSHCEQLWSNKGISSSGPGCRGRCQRQPWRLVLRQKQLGLWVYLKIITWIPRFSGILMWNMMMNQCIQRYPILKDFWSNLLAQTWQIRWRNLPDLSARVHRPVTFVQRWLHQYCTWKFQYNRTKE